MISQETKDKWAKENQTRFDETMRIAKEQGIPEEEIRKMFDTVNADMDKLVERLDKNGFFEKD